MPIVAEHITVAELFRPGWAQSAVVPGQLHGWQVPAGRETVSDDGSERVGFLIHSRGGRLHAEWMSQLERAEHGVEGVASDVAQSTGPKVPPTAPFEGQIGGVIRARRRRAQPEIPIESVRDFRC